MARGARGAGVTGDAPARLAWLLARAGESGMALDALCAEIPCSLPSIYRHVERARSAGWPIEAVHMADASTVVYRLRGYRALEPVDGAAPAPDVRPSRSSRSGRSTGAVTQQIDELARQGLTSTQIIQRLGVKPARVYARLWALRVSGEAPPPAPRSRSALVPGGRPERMRDMTLAGATPKEIAEALGTTSATVRTELHRLRCDGHLPMAAPIHGGD